MKKALCLLLAVVTLLALCSCEAKSLESAQKALEKKDYYVEDLPMDEFFLDEMDGKILIAFEKKGVDPDQYSDWDGDALYQTKNFVWVFYCENETDAEDMYEQIKEVTSSFNERMEELFEDEEEKEEAEANGMVRKKAVCEKNGNVVYFGTKAAIKIAK